MLCSAVILMNVRKITMLAADILIRKVPRYDGAIRRQCQIAYQTFEKEVQDTL